MAEGAAIASMTGFARAEDGRDGYDWTVECKSVNGRNLEMRFRLPPGLEALEACLRAEMGRRFKRGTVSVTLSLSRAAGGGGLRINRDMVDQVLALAQDLEAQGRIEPLRLDTLLSIRGVIEAADDTGSPDRAALQDDLMKAADAALTRLEAARLAEGERLKGVLTGHLAEIARLVGAAEASAAVQPASLRERLRSQVAALLDAAPALPEERLVQESALLVSRSDIREELDRLKAHLEAARELLAEGGAIGRRLDFLCQEFNREANTLCAKSADVELTRTGLALKATIEQFREQVQNIE